jgi:hypothetical protein
MLRKRGSIMLIDFGGALTSSDPSFAIAESSLIQV